MHLIPRQLNLIRTVTHCICMIHVNVKPVGPSASGFSDGSMTRKLYFQLINSSFATWNQLINCLLCDTLRTDRLLPTQKYPSIQRAPINFIYLLQGALVSVAIYLSLRDSHPQERCQERETDRLHIFCSVTSTPSTRYQYLIQILLYCSLRLIWSQVV
jgi:hypothetical protein